MCAKCCSCMPRHQQARCCRHRLCRPRQWQTFQLSFRSRSSAALHPWWLTMYALTSAHNCTIYVLSTMHVSAAWQPNPSAFCISPRVTGKPIHADIRTKTFMLQFQCAYVCICVCLCMHARVRSIGSGFLSCYLYAFSWALVWLSLFRPGCPVDMWCSFFCCHRQWTRCAENWWYYFEVRVLFL